MLLPCLKGSRRSLCLEDCFISREEPEPKRTRTTNLREPTFAFLGTLPEFTAWLFRVFMTSQLSLFILGHSTWALSLLPEFHFPLGVFQVPVRVLRINFPVSVKSEGSVRDPKKVEGKFQLPQNHPGFSPAFYLNKQSLK